MKKSSHHSTECPTAKAARLLSDAWTMLIVRDLLRAEARFCDLERSLAGISTRTLSAKLKKLESEGIVKKPAAGSYRLTKKGEALAGIEAAMRSYGKRYL